MTAARRESAVAEASLLERVAVALILHDHPFENALTRPDDPFVMVRTDPKFFVCAKALSRATAVLAALDQPAPGADEAAVWDEPWETDAARCCSCPSCNYYALDYEAHKDEPCILRVLIERILAARAHQPTPPAQAEAVAAVERVRAITITEDDVDQWIEDAITQGEQVGNYIYLIIRAALALAPADTGEGE